MKEFRSDKIDDILNRYVRFPGDYLDFHIPVAIVLNMINKDKIMCNLRKPFDSFFISTMRQTLNRLCERVNNCVFGYTYSGKIILLLISANGNDHGVWLRNYIQDICSITASMATATFCRLFKEELESYEILSDTNDYEYVEHLRSAGSIPALFKSFCFSLQMDHVGAFFTEVQENAIRSGVLSIAETFIPMCQIQSHKYESIKRRVDNFISISGNRYNDKDISGVCCIKETRVESVYNKDKRVNVHKNMWSIDDATPIFRENEEYVTGWVQNAIDIREYKK